MGVMDTAVAAPFLFAEKKVAVEVDGEVRAAYHFEEAITPEHDGAAVLHLPVSTPVMRVVSSWGVALCPDRPAVVADMHHEALHVDFECDRGVIWYGYTIATNIAGFQDLFADSFGIKGGGTLVSYVLELPCEQSIFWRTSGKGDTLIAPPTTVDMQTTGPFRWVFRTNGDNDIFTINVARTLSMPTITSRYVSLWERSCGDFDVPSKADLLLSKSTGDELVTGLVDFLARNFSYVLSPRPGHWRMPEQCQNVWSTRKGDCKDLVNLAVHILQGWGYRARPVFIAAKSDTVFPNPLGFRHVVLGWFNGDEQVTLDIVEKMQSVHRVSH